MIVYISHWILSGNFLTLSGMGRTSSHGFDSQKPDHYNCYKLQSYLTTIIDDVNKQIDDLESYEHSENN